MKYEDKLELQKDHLLFLLQNPAINKAQGKWLEKFLKQVTKRKRLLSQKQLKIVADIENKTKRKE